MSLDFITQCRLAFYLFIFIFCARRLYLLFSEGIDSALLKPEQLGFQSQFLVGAPWLSLNLILKGILPSIFWCYAISLFLLSIFIILKAKSQTFTLLIKTLVSFASSALLNYILVEMIMGIFIGTPESLRHKLE